MSLNLAYPPKTYVVGFAFNNELTEVALIRKRRPEFQKGYLNGVGGSVELGESPVGAMVREFEEETGVTTTKDDWRKFHEERYLKSGNRVHFYATWGEDIIGQVMTTTDEEVRCHLVRDLDSYRVMYNLSYLIPMAISYLKNPEHRYVEG